MPPERGHSELFETTLIQQDFALGVVSIPLSLVHARAEVATAERLIDRLGLLPAARIPSGALDQAITALIVNETVDGVVNWLREPPRPVTLDLTPVTLSPGILFDLERPPRLDLEHPPKRRQAPLAKRPARPRKPRPSKDSAKAREIEEAATEFARDAIVPYARSPVDLTALSELFHGAAEFGIWLVSPRTNPFLILEVPGGYLLLRAVQGIGEGLRRGLSEGVHYRLLQLFKVPDDWRPN
jgi:hypothetical protein